MSGRANRPQHGLGYRTALAILIAVGTMVLLGGCSDDQSEPESNGTVLKGAEPSPPFELTNHVGQAISLDSFQDRVVVHTLSLIHI